MNVSPARDFLLVEAEQKSDKEATTTSGIVLVTKTDDRDLQVTSGKVIKIGPEVRGYKVGQEVIYKFFSGNQYWEKGSGEEKQYHFVIEHDVLGVKEL